MKIIITEKKIYKKEYDVSSLDKAKTLAEEDYLDGYDKPDDTILIITQECDDDKIKIMAEEIFAQIPELLYLDGEAKENSIKIIRKVITGEN